MNAISLGELPEKVYTIAERLNIQPININISDIIQNRVTYLGAQNMEWVLSELLHNAKKFHPTHHPSVTLEMMPCSDVEHFLLRISDNGRVLTSEQIARAWTPYYQGEKYFTGQSPGVGLGLPTIASLVWQAGGQCRIFNRIPPPGVTVELELPFT
jgi:K+-sensing histidine kinase KdpD